MADETGQIDWEHLDSIADGFAPDFMEVFRAFAEEMPDLIGSLNEHLASGDLDAVWKIAHQVKGSSANFGFIGVSNPASQIELLAKAGVTEGLASLSSQLLPSYEAALAELLAARNVSL